MLYDTKNYTKRQSLNEGFWDDFTNRDVMQDYHVSGPSTSPSVNILQDDKEYQIELIAPGLCRDNYEIQVHDDVLSIRAEQPDKDKENERSRYRRREYYPRDFERSFVLPKNARQEEIAASCSDGILTVHIPVRHREEGRQKRNIKIN